MNGFGLICNKQEHIAFPCCCPSCLQATQIRYQGVCHAFTLRCLAEPPVQVIESFKLLRDSGVDVVTLGQYMRPTKKHMAVSEFVTPAAFEAYQKAAESMGFLYVASGPMVRSSYRAGEFYLKNVLQGRRQQQQQGGSSSSTEAGGAAVQEAAAA
jgi:hypothetical protein